MTERPPWQDILDEDLEDSDDIPGEIETEEHVETEDLAALKNCLQALADAIASTNLAVINAGQHDMAAAGARVQASVGALKRFHDAFAVLKGKAEEESE